MDNAGIETGSGSIMLYHGSKSGITGKIAPISREQCDFGKGFYMGTEQAQPLSLICNFPDAKLYKINLQLTDLKCLELEVGIEWALLIAYNRGRLDMIKETAIYQKLSAMTSGCDLVLGNIANDRMFVVLDRFCESEITDSALTNSLSALRLGRQYVAITEKACSQAIIVEEKTIGVKERNALRYKAETHRLEGIRLADEICKKYRRNGRFFDEILNEAVL